MTANVIVGKHRAKIGALQKPSNETIEYAKSLNMHDLGPGPLAFQYDPTEYRTYTVLYHGVGLCDEAPAIYFPDAWADYGHNGVLQPGMVICVESFLGRKSGGPGVKLEDQVLITDDGYEVLTTYPYEDVLLS